MSPRGIAHTEHVLRRYTPGVNRFVPGRYECECGYIATGKNEFEHHQAEAVRPQDESK